MRTRFVRTLAVVACFFAVIALSSPASAGKLAGVDMPDSVTAGDSELVLNGMALRTKLIFKVYVAGLYLPEKSSSGDQILSDDSARHLKMEFVRKVGKDSICDAWNEGLAANTPNASSDLEAQFATLCSWMADVGGGDSYEFTYVPGEGTTVRVKGTDQGALEGKAFADALFASWIGPSPGPGEDFKADLLGG